MKKIILSSLLVLLPFLAQAQESAPAPESPGGKRLYIILDQPLPDKKFPIAIPDLLPKNGSDKDGLAIKIADVLRNDVKLAGYFNLISKTAYPENPGAIIPPFDFKPWSALEAAALVKGGYSLDGKNIVLEMRLFDPFTGEMLVGKEYKVEKNNYRAAVHRFMDEIMLALTGERGIFSTKLAAACGRVGQREIVIADIDGANQFAVTKNKSINVSPDWERNGAQLAFTSYAKYFPEIFLSATNGKGNPKRITFNNSMNITPAWSPDNSSIAVSSSMSGDPEIYLIDPQGNKLAQLTRSRGIDLGPAWSPDAQNIIFASERVGGLHLFVMNRNGGDVKRLTYAGYQNDQADWSPKGDKVAFTSRDSGNFDIFTMNADGSVIQRLTAGSGNNESPSYSPDGRYLIYTSTRKYKSDVYLMLWDGSSQNQITDSGDCVNPDWSPWMQ